MQVPFADIGAFADTQARFADMYVYQALLQRYKAFWRIYRALWRVYHIFFYISFFGSGMYGSFVDRQDSLDRNAVI